MRAPGIRPNRTGSTARHGIHQGHLEIEGGLAAGGPVCAEALRNGADVLMLEIDRAAVAVDAGLKIENGGAEVCHGSGGTGLLRAV